MNNPSNIERVVMRRVYTIRALRPLVSGASLALLVALLALWGIGREVWVAMVFHNAPESLAALPRFYLAAFAHTRFVVQTLALLALASVIYLARETAHILSRMLTPVFA